jgi:hypothetical protein
MSKRLIVVYGPLLTEWATDFVKHSRILQSYLNVANNHKYEYEYMCMYAYACMQAHIAGPFGPGPWYAGRGQVYSNFKTYNK